MRAGPIAYLMSQPMLLGFIPAATILIIATQLPGAFGVVGQVPGDGIVPDGAWALVHPGSWETTSLVLTFLIVGAVRLGPRLHRMFPVVLIAVVAGAVSGSIADYGGTRVGEIPAGLQGLGITFITAGLMSLGCLAMAGIKL